MEENTVPEADPKGENPEEERADALSDFLSDSEPIFVIPELTRETRPLDKIYDYYLPATCDVGISTSLPMIAPSQKRECLREWWHNLLREYGRFYCYGVFLMLQADTEAIKYVTDYALELNQASGKNCAILGLGNIPEETFDEFDELWWNITAIQQVEEGNSLKIAELFHIPITRFPSLILFRDIRSSEYILVKLKGLTAVEIAEKMRSIYQAINQAADTKKDPLQAVCNLRQSEEFRLKKRSIVSGIRKIAGQTLETAIEAIIKTIIK